LVEIAIILLKKLKFG